MQYKLLISFSRLGTGTGTGKGTGTGTGGCNNEAEGRYCETLANIGYCTKEADFMEKLCCKACKSM